ncbi:MAG: carbohydrate ABC transporter permease [Clostridia bacterium]|nr:carbohydrate ABC transporter permease [Clostridia bacterium]
MNSLKNSFEFYTTNTMLLPQKWLFSNYADIFDVFVDEKGNTYITMLFNSLWWTAANSIPSMFISCMVAYVVEKFDFRGKDIIWGVIIIMMILPLYGSGAAGYKLTFTLGLYDSPLLVIRSWGGYGGFAFMMLSAFFRGLPRDYMDAAEIDGAGYFRTFVTIMLPIAMGPIVALLVKSFIGCWNEYMTMIIYMPSFPTLSSALYTFEKKMANGANVVIYYAGALITIIPVLVLFTCFQDVFLNNVSFGGLKG